ncbi:hypothetical protein AHYW_002042 [Providencia manganoxydans]|uniref:hypothetical protein n=1 Tax=Providencia TaxID=586 RepID=UPI0011220CEE|nr:hypothetical protein [Providencia stuartii]
MIKNKKLFTASIILFLSTGMSIADELCSSSPVLRTQINDKGNIICFSTRPIPVCLSPAIVVDSYLVNVDFHCLLKAEYPLPDSHDWTDRVDLELSNKRVDYSETIVAANSCACPNN